MIVIVKIEGSPEEEKAAWRQLERVLNGMEQFGVDNDLRLRPEINVMVLKEPKSE